MKKMHFIKFLFLLFLYNIRLFASDIIVDGIAYKVDLNTMEATVVAGDYYFRDIVIPESFNYNGRSFNVTKIGKGAFYYVSIYSSNSCAYITSLTIPNTVTEIEESAFSGNKYLKKLVIPKGITKVGNFNYFSAKDSIIFEDSPQPISLSTYKNSKFGHFTTDYLYLGREISSENYYGLVSSSIRILEYGDNIKIPYHMDYNTGYNDYYVVHNLETVILGANITRIFYGRNAYNLNTIIAKMKIPIGFEDNYGYFTNEQYMNIKLIVPEGTKERYLNTEGWNKFFLIEEEDNSDAINNLHEADIKDNIWTITGRKITTKSLSHFQGIYIKNRKKFVVK